MKVVFIFLVAIVLVNCDLNVKDYLNRFGYFPDNGPINDQNLVDAIKKYQHTFGLNESGVADEETLKLMHTPRCGMKDHGHGAKNDHGWYKTALTYFFYNYTPDLQKAVVQERTARALRFWSDVTPLNFTRIDRDGDIVVAFGRGRHYDGRKVCFYPFDGPGGVLAHAFFPTDGRIHFDDDEYYTVKSKRGINYLWVATHEMGHIMGLEHDTHNRDAVMFPYYRPYDPKGMHLHPNDIYRIQRLYGKHGDPPRTNPPTHKPVTTKKAVTKPHGHSTTKKVCKDDSPTCQAHKQMCKGHTTSWTDWMKRYCQKTCGYCGGGSGGGKKCTPTCRDIYSRCNEYANRCKGYDRQWTVYMKENCARTCKYCCYKP